MIVTRDGVDRSTNYTPDELAAITVVKVGWDGEVGQGTIPVPDPAGNQEPYEGEQLLLEQDGETIIDGFLGAVSTERGGGATGTRRVHTMTLADDNALLSGYATAGWARPAEAPADRWQAFVDAFLPGGIDTTWLLTTHEAGITLPKKTYRSDSLFDDISADTIGPTGKTVYMENRNFHWHLPTEGQTCSITIHDTSAETSTRFQPRSSSKSKDGMDLRNRILARNDKGVQVSVSDATSISRHNSGGLVHMGYSEYGDETAAEMTRDIGVTLAERKDERTTWTYMVGPLTAAQAVALIPGSQMTVTVGVHGLSGSVKRIARVTLTYRHGARSGRFMATVELGYPVRKKRKPTKTSSAVDSGGGSGVKGSGGTSGDCGCPPFTDDCPFSTFDDMNRTNASAWGTTSSAMGTWAGLLVAQAGPGGMVLNDSMVPTHGIMQLQRAGSTFVGSAEERIVGPGPWSTGDWKIRTSVSVINANLTDWEVIVGNALVAWGRNSGGPGVGQLQVFYNGDSTFFALANTAFDGMGFVDIELRKNGSTVTAIVSGLQIQVSNFDAPGPLDDLVIVMDGLAGGGTGGAEAHFGPIDIANCSAAPSAGQAFPVNATGDGSTTVFTATYPFRAIRSATVAGSDVTPDVTPSGLVDGAYTTYTFAHAPHTGATIRVVLEGAP